MPNREISNTLPHSNALTPGTPKTSLSLMLWRFY